MTEKVVLVLVDNMVTLDDLQEKLQTKLESRGFDNIEDEDITDEIQRAIKQINRCRHFDPTEEILVDPKYEDMIIPLALTAFAKIGAEGQTAHKENGVDRTYTSGGDYPADMLEEIIPLIK